ncbi:MAG: methionyl-tRNA formyltransferase [Acidimicrobiales bacterium]
MRLAFLGTPQAAVPTLRALVSSGHDVAVVVTRPDRRRGRGGDESHSPVHEAALELGLTVAHSLGELDGADVERGVVVAYGALVPAATLARVPMLNVHFSLLPRWRGAAPVERAILAGDDVTGVSVMSLDVDLDTGPVHLTRSVEVDDLSVSALTSQLADVGADALVEVLATPDLLNSPHPQVGEPVYAPKIRPETYHLDPEMALVDALRTVRLERAFTIVAGRRVRVVSARAAESAPAPGTVMVAGSHLVLGLRDGGLELDDVVPEGGRTMSGFAWWIGARLNAETARWT